MSTGGYPTVQCQLAGFFWALVLVNIMNGCERNRNLSSLGPYILSIFVPEHYVHHAMVVVNLIKGFTGMCEAWEWAPNIPAKYFFQEQVKINSVYYNVQLSWRGVLARTSDRAVAQAGSLNGLAARFRLESARPFADEAISDMLSLEIRSLAETCVPAYWEPPLYFEATGAQVT